MGLRRIGGAIRDPLSGRSYVYQAMQFQVPILPNRLLKRGLAKAPSAGISKKLQRILFFLRESNWSGNDLCP